MIAIFHLKAMFLASVKLQLVCKRTLTEARDAEDGRKLEKIPYQAEQDS